MAGKTTPTGIARIEPDQQNERPRKIGCPPRHLSQAAPTPRRMAAADCCRGADGDEGDGETDTEAKHQDSTERYLLQLKADQQDGDRGRTWDEPTRQPERNYLPSWGHGKSCA